jgi:hypothetical protein
MNTSKGVAQMLLRHHSIKAKLLSPLGISSEICWLIMLHLFLREGDSCTSISAILEEPIYSLKRYLKLLEEYQYVEALNTGEYQLTDTLRENMVDNINEVTQDIASSFGI